MRSDSWTSSARSSRSNEPPCAYTAGTQAALRAYWTNNSFSANVTADIPNESRLEPAEWGTANVE
jgi:hypothetical protein